MLGALQLFPAVYASLGMQQMRWTPLRAPLAGACYTIGALERNPGGAFCTYKCGTPGPNQPIHLYNQGPQDGTLKSIISGWGLAIVGSHNLPEKCAPYKINPSKPDKESNKCHASSRCISRCGLPSVSPRIYLWCWS